MPSYDLCPRVRISDITRQVAQAVSAAAREIPGPLRLAGHSAGGHLVSRMAAPGLLPGDVAERLARIMPISPLSDLRPLMRTRMNDDFRLDEAGAIAESPIFTTDRLPAQVAVWVGAAERPAFLDQARWLGEAWGCEVVIDESLHHFDVIDGLVEADSPLCRAVTGA